MAAADLRENKARLQQLQQQQRTLTEALDESGSLGHSLIDAVG